MGAPIELKTVLSNTRSSVRRYEALAVENGTLAKAAAATVMLAGVALAKQLLFRSEALAASGPELADDTANERAGEVG